MANDIQIVAFIEEVGNKAQEVARKRKKWVLPSVAISQGAIETGWGTATRMVKFNALFGIKATKQWVDNGGKVYSSTTMEYYDGWSEEVALFRAYDTIEDSINDYYDLITSSSRYAGAVNNNDPYTSLVAIKNGGYATDPDYVSKCMGAYVSAEKRGRPLTAYDVGVGEGGTVDPPINPDYPDIPTDPNQEIQLGDLVYINGNTLHGKKYGTNFFGAKVRRHYVQYIVSEQDRDYFKVATNLNNPLRIHKRYLSKTKIGE